MFCSLTSNSTAIQTIRSGYIVLTHSHIFTVSINSTVKTVSAQTEDPYFTTKRQIQPLLLQSVEIFPSYTTGTAVSLHFSFYYGVHSVPCNDQCKIFQIINGPLQGRKIFTIPENHDLSVLRSRSYLTDFKPFLQNC